MIVNEEGILEFLSQTKDALDSYINLRNTNILSVAFTKDEYDDFLSLLFHLQMYERELNELIETEDLKDELVLCLAELLIFDIIEVCRELHDDYGEEAQLKVRYGELDEAKIAVIRLLKGFHRPLVADWQLKETMPILNHMKHKKTRICMLLVMGLQKIRCLIDY